MPQPKVDPTKVQVRGARVLIQEDPEPVMSAGGIIIPSTSKLKGRRNTKATVLSAGDGRGKPDRDGNEILWEMPKPGSRVIIASIAGLPDTPNKQKEMFMIPGNPDDGSKTYTIHVMDVLAVLEGDGPEPEIE